MNNKNSQYNSMALYFCSYFSLGAFCPLLSQYLSSIGFTGSMVGVATSLGTLGAVLGGLLIGELYANANRKKLLIFITFFLAAIMAIVSSTVLSFYAFAIIYMIFHAIQEPVHALCDSMVDSNGGNFPLIRSFGAIGYAVASYGAGLIANHYGLKLIFYINACFYILSGFIALREKEPPHYSSNEAKVKLTELLKEKKFIKLLIVSFFVCGASMANNTYFAYLYTSAGGDYAGVGLAFLLMCGSEMVCMMFLPFLEKKLSIQKIIAFSIFVALVRFSFYATGPSTGLLLGTSFLQGIMSGFILVEIVKYFGRIVPLRLRSLSISTYYALGSNFGTIMCNLLGGFVLDAFGAKGVYFFFAILQLLAILLYFIFGLQKDLEK